MVFVAGFPGALRCKRAPPAGRTAFWPCRPDRQCGASGWRICQRRCFLKIDFNNHICSKLFQDRTHIVAANMLYSIGLDTDACCILQQALHLKRLRSRQMSATHKGGPTCSSAKCLVISGGRTRDKDGSQKN